MDELVAVEASTRHDYMAHMALGEDEPRPTSNKREQKRRLAKRAKLKALIQRKDDFLLVDFLKRVSHVKGFL